MIIFDTDIFTLFSRANAPVVERYERTVDEDFAVTVITRMEVLRGRFDSILKAADDSQLRTASERFISSRDTLDLFPTIDLDDFAIEHFERLRTLKKTKKMGRSDMLIASIVLSQKALLVTRNVKDFKDVPGLRFENWAD